jgi:hypothetical protein
MIEHLFSRVTTVTTATITTIFPTATRVPCEFKVVVRFLRGLEGVRVKSRWHGTVVSLEQEARRRRLGIRGKSRRPIRLGIRERQQREWRLTSPPPHSGNFIITIV